MRAPTSKIAEGTSHENDGSITTFDQKTWEFIRELILKREGEPARETEREDTK